MLSENEESRFGAVKNDRDRVNAPESTRKKYARGRNIYGLAMDVDFMKMMRAITISAIPPPSGPFRRSFVAHHMAVVGATADVAGARQKRCC